jgi:hypothetical protein
MIKHFVIDEPLIQEFAELEATQFHYCDPLFKDKVWGLFEEVRTWYVPLIEKMLLREH